MIFKNSFSEFNSNWNFPEANKNFINKELEQQIEIVKGIVSTVHALRKNNSLKVRQPLAEIKLFSQNPLFFLKDYEDIILQETNIKRLEIVKNSSLVCDYIVKPNFKVLGEKYKNKIKDIANDIRKLNTEQIQSLYNNGEERLECGIKINKSDCLFETIAKDNVCIDKYNDIMIALDIKITEGLKLEGIARDFINLIQNYRKKNNFAVEDRINIKVYCEDEDIKKSLETFKQTIKEFLLCNIFLFFEKNTDEYEQMEIEGKIFFASIEKI